MRMPDQISPEMLAPCGMVCTVCYRRCRPRRPCPGCRGGEDGKPGGCRACAIKDCARERGLSHCYRCGEFPCERLRRLDRSYRTRYGASLVENGETAAERGERALLDDQRERWRCGCGGVVSLHDGVCSACGRPLGGPAGAKRREGEPHD